MVNDVLNPVKTHLFKEFNSNQRYLFITYFPELLTYIVIILLNTIKTHLNIEYISKAKEFFNDVLFRATDVCSEHHNGS